ncbi:hypothetical protein BDK62_103407 [Halomonas alkaliantarctica]|nr:hypothetical protein BDK62_103407 [Halomonas alkaliantarctica]
MARIAHLQAPSANGGALKSQGQSFQADNPLCLSPIASGIYKFIIFP